jgi:hypothetical protein
MVRFAALTTPYAPERARKAAGSAGLGAGTRKPGDRMRAKHPV